MNSEAKSPGYCPGVFLLVRTKSEVALFQIEAGPDEYGLANLYGGTALRSDGRQTSGCCSSRSHDEAAYRAASVDAFEVGLSPKYRLLLDFDDEAGRGLLRLVALSIEGLPGGRLTGPTLQPLLLVPKAVLFGDGPGKVDHG